MIYKSHNKKLHKFRNWFICKLKLLCRGLCHKLCVIFMLSFCFSLNGLANEDQSIATNDLMTLLANLKTMQANFTQNSLQAKQNNQSLNNTLINSVKNQVTGIMALQRPGKFRWEILQPTQQLIIANANQAWFYDVDLQQVTRQKLDINQAGNPAQLLSGDNSLLQNTFVVRYVDVKQFSANFLQANIHNQQQLKCFKLQPKQANNAYQYITLCFMANNLVAMQMADNFGSVNEFVFSKIKVNTNIGNDLFNFHQPKNVDVINQ